MKQNNEQKTKHDKRKILLERINEAIVKGLGLKHALSSTYRNKHEVHILKNQRRI